MSGNRERALDEITSASWHGRTLEDPERCVDALHAAGLIPGDDEVIVKRADLERIIAVSAPVINTIGDNHAFHSIAAVLAATTEADES